MAFERFARARQLHSLPSEILLQVMPYLDVSSLRNFRLSCKSFQHLPSRWLFQTLYLYPHRHSFDMLLGLSREKEICSFVRCLVYDIQWFDTYQTLHNKLLASKSTTRKELRRLTESQFDTLVRVGDEDAIIIDLTTLLSNLTSLTDIHVHDLRHPFSKKFNNTYVFADVPEYYRRSLQDLYPLSAPPSLGDFPFTEDKDFPAAAVASCVLEAVHRSQRSIKRLELEGITTEDILKTTPLEEFPKYRPVLSHIETLRVDFGCIPRCRERRALSRLPIFLDQCINLRHVSIEFGALGRPCPEMSSFSSYASQSLMDDLFPETPAEDRRLIASAKLRTLDLRSFRCTESELIAILQQSSEVENSNFWDFSVWDLALLSDHGAAGPRACLVRLIKFIRDLMLYHVQFAGWLTNSGQQDWRAELAEGNNTLSDRVHEYMLSKGDYEDEDCECPLEFAAIPAGQDDVKAPVEDTEENKKWKGDSSWEMSYREASPGRFFVLGAMIRFMAEGH